MFEEIMKLINELYEGPTAPDEWYYAVYDKALECGARQEDATELAEAAEKIANIFCIDMMNKIDK